MNKSLFLNNNDTDDEEGKIIFLNNSDFESDDEKKEETKEEKTIWDDLVELVKKLETLDADNVKKYIDNEMLDEKADLIEAFEKDFSDIDNTDKLKLEVLALLGKLGITIYI